jgi:hypothetical protein
LRATSAVDAWSFETRIDRAPFVLAGPQARIAEVFQSFVEAAA